MKREGGQEKERGHWGIETHQNNETDIQTDQNSNKRWNLEEERRKRTDKDLRIQRQRRTETELLKGRHRMICRDIRKMQQKILRNINGQTNIKSESKG